MKGSPSHILGWYESSNQYLLLQLVMKVSINNHSLNYLRNSPIVTAFPSMAPLGDVISVSFMYPMGHRYMNQERNVWGLSLGLFDVNLGYLWRGPSHSPPKKPITFPILEFTLISCRGGGDSCRNCRHVLRRWYVIVVDVVPHVLNMGYHLWSVANAQYNPLYSSWSPPVGSSDLLSSWGGRGIQSSNKLAYLPSFST